MLRKEQVCKWRDWLDLAYEDDIEYFAANLAEYDPEKKDRILENYPRAEITKLWLTKTWDLRHED